MRIARLDLLGYGHFTGRALDFPRSATDFHIVYGANEAGKSTALAAIGDLMFGIPRVSSYGFLHAYNDMRIGGVLEDANGEVTFVRRKSTKDSLIDADGTPLPQAAGRLSAMLGGTGRDFFQQMFSLDHSRLETGGHAMLDPGNDAGQAIFAAGAGLEDLRGILNSITEEADTLWAPRKSQRREFYKAMDRYKDAERERNTHILTARNWRELRRDFDNAKSIRDEAEEKFRSISAEGRRLSRIRRVYPEIRRREKLLEELKSLAIAPILAENAQEAFEGARQELSKGHAQIETLRGQIAQLRDDIKELSWDSRLIDQAPRVESLEKRNTELNPGRDDLPKRQTELETFEAELQRLGSELGWTDLTPEILAGRIPSQAKVQRAQHLLREVAALDADVNKGTEALDTARSKLSRSRRQLKAAGIASDVSGLAAAIGAVRRSGDIMARLRMAKQKHVDAEEQVKNLLAKLHPETDEGTAVKTPAPSGAAIEKHKRRQDELQKEHHDLDRQRTEIKEEIERFQDEITHLQQERLTVSTTQLEDARTHRDKLWELILQHYMEHAAEQAEAPELSAGSETREDLFKEMGDAVRVADELADRRFETAEASARLAEITHTLSLHKTKQTRLIRRDATLSKRKQKLCSEWEEMWQHAPFAPLSPDEMTQWIDMREELSEAVDRRRDAAGERAVADQENQEARDSLISQMTPLGAQALEELSLPALLERAESLKEEIESSARKRQELEQTITETETEIEDRRRDLDHAKDEKSRWQQNWSKCLNALDLASTTPPEAATTLIEIIDRMREQAGQAHELRNRRIGKIERDLQEFGDLVAALVFEIAEDLTDRSAEDAIHELGRRREAAQKDRKTHTEKSSQVENIEKQIQKQKTDMIDAEATIDTLMETAGTDSLEGLQEAISKSDQRRSLQQNLREVEARLLEDGDGFAIEDLERECADVNPDDIAVQEENIGERLQQENDRKAEAAVQLAEAQNAIDAVGGGDSAAQAEAERQESLAQMTAASERYMRTGTLALLLKWAIERYRREKQGPLLARAGKLFGTMTLNSFTALRIDYDSKDKPVLTGVRPDETSVPVSGMSDGTVDQLYMALRIASLEEYLEHADALPFIADDLFVNFDNERAAAGFQVLAGLAGKTQVLFFTHHQHLVAMAREILGSEISVVSCTGETL